MSPVASWVSPGFDLNDAVEADDSIAKHANLPAADSQPFINMLTATWTDQACQEATYNTVINGIRTMAKCGTRWGTGILKISVKEVAGLIHDAAVIKTRLTCTPSEIAWYERTGDCDLQRLQKTRQGASLRALAQDVNADIASIAGLVKTILSSPAAGENGKCLQQYDMHGNPSPAHRSIPWSEFHKRTTMVTRCLQVLEHAHTQTDDSLICAAYGDGRWK